MAKSTKGNPFKAGAGHSPPHLAGRDVETEGFLKLLRQDDITQNVVLTGLRGVGKTVLMDDIYKPLAIKEGWVWVGSDFSESAFVDERTLCQRLFTDLSLFTASLALRKSERAMGLIQERQRSEKMDYRFLLSVFETENGLSADKLKAVLALVWTGVQATGKKGIVFAYDEAQVVQDREDKDQYPLAVLLETFQSVQRKGMRYMLLLTGLPTLFPRLVESRTYAERMFKIQEIGKLNSTACREAIEKPLADNPIRFSKESVDSIIKVSSCYPYFIQFICREAYDLFKSAVDLNRAPPSIPMETLIRKLDADFFAGRWSKVPDRQRELLLCIASLTNASEEFTVSQIVDVSKEVAVKHGIKAFKAGDVSVMMPKLINAGLIYKNRHGRYLLAVPLFDAFIKRQFDTDDPSLFDGFED